jgi:HEAT repeat protein
MRRLVGFCLAFVAGGLALLPLTGCGSGSVPEQATQIDPQALFEEWKGLIQYPAANRDNERYLVVAAVIAQIKPDLLGTMLDVAVEPARSPESRLMALGSLTGLLPLALAPRLVELSGPSADSKMRATIAILMAPMKTPETEQQLRVLAGDGDKRVRFAGQVGLAIQGDAAARQSLRELYFKEDLPTAYRERIAITLANQTTSDDMKVLCAAIGDPALEATIAPQAIGALVALGDPAAIATLEQCANSNESKDIRTLARDAVKAIQDKATPSEPPAAPAAPAS